MEENVQKVIEKPPKPKGKSGMFRNFISGLMDRIFTNKVQKL